MFRKIILSIIIVSLLASLASALPEEPTGIPTSTNTVTTVYYTVSIEDKDGKWCSDIGCKETSQEYEGELGVTSKCLDQNKGFCCITQSKRGFYEEVKCQGSGVADGKVYRYDTIKSTQAESPTLSSTFTNGKTAKGTNPTPHRTIAVNNKPGTTCYIPYGADVYLDFGYDNEWSGWYLAEDTGSAFAGNCKIDVYAGVGKSALNAALPYVSGKKPNIWVYINGEQSTDLNEVATLIGVFSYRPSAKVTTNYNFLDYSNKIKDSTIKLKDECQGEINDNLKTCIQNQLSGLNSGNLKWEMNCQEGEERVFYDFVENINLVKESSDDDCLYNFSMDGINANGEYEVMIDSEIIVRDSYVKYSLGDYSYSINGFNAYLEDADNMQFYTIRNTYLYYAEYKNGRLADNKIQEKGKVYNSDKVEYGKGDVYLYKKASDILFLNKENYQKLVDMGKTKCSVTRDTYKFCVKTNKYVSVFNDGKFGNNEIVYKFAIDFK